MKNKNGRRRVGRPIALLFAASAVIPFAAVTGTTGADAAWKPQGTKSSYAASHSKKWAARRTPARSTAWTNRKWRAAPARRAVAALPAAAPAVAPGSAPAVTAVPAPPPRPLKVLTRAEILAADPDRLARIGRRIMIGYHSYDQVKALVEHKAIAGLFITDHNVRGRKIEAIAKDIEALQLIRRAQGLPRLIIAADQEGGWVSRLSPPLKWQPPLSQIVEKLKTDAERETAVREYASVQARELEKLGVTMNFGPVVDLRLSLPTRADGETRLYWRAISKDPFLVAKVADWYCDTLTKFNIMCTLKHFPGLGRVTRDTHVISAEVTASEGVLELNDWVPFERVMKKPGVATMLGHVRVAAVDKTDPASYSDVIVNQLIRKKWNNDGLLVTDDFSMGAITRAKEGIGGAALKALNAGVDVILLSFNERHYDTVVSALLEADAKGELDHVRHNQTVERMKRYIVTDEPEAPVAVTVPGSAGTPPTVSPQ